MGTVIIGEEELIRPVYEQRVNTQQLRKDRQIVGFKRLRCAGKILPNGTSVPNAEEENENKATKPFFWSRVEITKH